LRRRVEQRMTEGLTDRQVASLRALLEQVVVNLDDQ
jgi:hypothetical protein